MLKTPHFLLVPMAAWGHIRPLCTVVARFLREQDNIVITFIVVPHMLERARAEISGQFRDESLESSQALQRIRILSPPIAQDNKLFGLTGQTFADAYPAVYETLYQAKPITCSVTGTIFDAVPPPSLVIMDILAFPQLRATRAVSGSSVPIIGFVPTGVGCNLRRFAPESMGGVGDYGARIDAEIARTGLSDAEIGPKILYHTEGKLVRIPGVPAMYDYEFLPQKLALPDVPAHALFRGAYDFFRECDSVITSLTHIQESVSLDAMKQWLSDMQKGFYVFGPLLAYGSDIGNSEGGAGTEVETFLGEMLAQHGKRSVFFVSFGTIYWPADPRYIDELIEALIEKKAPFIFAYASPFAKVSEELQNKIKSSGLGMLSAWFPQQFILNHPATGWFVSHAGFNGVIESLACGIPLICWPFGGDQPTIAAHITDNLKVAFELFEVRTGEKGLGKPVHRIGRAPKGTHEAAGVEIRQTIDLCRGEKGQELGRNAEETKAKFTNAWGENSVARKEVREFLHKYT